MSHPAGYRFSQAIPASRDGLTMNANLTLQDARQELQTRIATLQRNRERLVTEKEQLLNEVQLREGWLYTTNNLIREYKAIFDQVYGV